MKISIIGTGYVDLVTGAYPPNLKPKILYQDFRDGDIRHSFADISKVHHSFVYLPEYGFTSEMKETINLLCKI
jgi:hypothetical protein